MSKAKGDSKHEGITKSGGRSSSCFLCRKRKIKCDHRLPACSNCIKADAQCVQPKNYITKVPEKDQYTLLLERKIKYLENLLEKDEVKQANMMKNYKKISPFIDENDSENSANNSDLLQAPTETANPDRNYTESDSTFGILDFKKVSNNSVEEDVILNIDTIDYDTCLFSPFNLNNFLEYEPVFEIDDTLSRIFLNTYFSRLQFKFPILDEKEVSEFHNAIIAKNLFPYMNDINYFHFLWCRMFLIFAISSSLHESTGKYSGPQPARFFATAIRHSTKISKISIMNQIEILFLSVLYLIKTDKDSKILYDMMSECIKLTECLNLHKSSTYKNISNDLKDKQMRIFWCVYLLERVIAIAVSKPYSLAESEIDVDIPLFEYEPSEAVHPNNGITFINQCIKIRRIESLLVEELDIIENTNSGTKATKDQLPLVQKFFNQLEIWRADCEGFSRDIESETLRLYYYRSIRLLIQPYLELLEPEDRLFRECQAAAGQICQLFKVFHKKTVRGHSTTAIHTVFVAGVTLIYCIWLSKNREDIRRNAMSDEASKIPRVTVTESLFSGLDDLRACSICLYVMAERSKFALSFRDTFDQLIDATIGNLILRCGGSSNEIAYNHSPGMPPAIVRNQKHQRGIKKKLSTEDRLEEEEKKRKQVKLQKNSVPQSLSILLINSPPLQPSDSGNDSFSSNNMLPPLSNTLRNSFSNHHSYQESFANERSDKPPSNVNVQNPKKSLPIYERSLFNNNTHSMINNISNWTEGFGQQPILNEYGLFNNSWNTSDSLNNGGSSPNLLLQSPNALIKDQTVDSSKNFPTDDFSWVSDDYGFLA